MAGRGRPGHQIAAKIGTSVAFSERPPRGGLSVCADHAAVRLSPIGTKQTLASAMQMSAFGGNPSCDVRFRKGRHRTDFNSCPFITQAESPVLFYRDCSRRVDPMQFMLPLPCAAFRPERERRRGRTRLITLVGELQEPPPALFILFSKLPLAVPSVFFGRSGPRILVSCYPGCYPEANSAKNRALR